jgi:hypothetical protein
MGCIRNITGKCCTWFISISKRFNISNMFSCICYIRYVNTLIRYCWVLLIRQSCYVSYHIMSYHIILLVCLYSFSFSNVSLLLIYIQSSRFLCFLLQLHNNRMASIW